MPIQRKVRHQALELGVLLPQLPQLVQFILAYAWTILEAQASARLLNLRRTKANGAAAELSRALGEIEPIVFQILRDLAACYASVVGWRYPELAACARSSTGQSIGLRIRGLGVRIPPGAPNISIESNGFSSTPATTGRLSKRFVDGAGPK